MTESECLTSTDPNPMLDVLQGQKTERKLRLFVVGCCRRIWQRMSDDRSRYAVELAERSADEPVSDKQLDAASGAAEEAFEDSLTDDEGKPVGDQDARPDAATAASYASSPELIGPELLRTVLEAAAGASSLGAVQEAAAQAAMLRDLFGNPYRPLKPIPADWLAWNDGTILKLAQAAYEERLLPSGELNHAYLTVLVDALEDAGCEDADLLSHLCSPRPHFRGCFVLDALLGFG